MIRRRAASAVLLLGLLVLPARASQEAAVLYPPDLALTSEETIRLFAFRAEKGEADNVSVNGIPGAPLEGDLFLKGEAKLFPGLNLVQAGGKMVRVFSLPGTKMDRFLLPTGKEEEPLEFRGYRLHPALDDGCEGCHLVENGKLKAKDQKEACCSCHNDFSKAEGSGKVFVHAPVVSGECTGCHDPHFSLAPKLQKLEKGCLECHDAFPSKGTVHRPVAEGRCVSCHSPHAGPAPKQLIRPGNALCLGCHASPHAQHRSSEIRAGGSTVIPELFPLDNGSLACAGCHAPHQSTWSRLFRATERVLCSNCHAM